MSRLWKWVNDKDYSKEVKIRIFLFFNCVIYSALGFVIWLAVSQFALNSLDWAFCFIGYMGFFIGYVGGFLFLSRQ